MAKSIQDKEKELLEKIEKAKKDLAKLKDKRKQEIGDLAVKAGLDQFDNDVLQQQFETIVKALSA